MGHASHAVRLVGTGKAMKFTPQWMSTSTCSDFPLMIYQQRAVEGVIAATFGEFPDSTDPLLQKYKKEAFGKYAAKGESWGLFYYAGILFAEPWWKDQAMRTGPTGRAGKRNGRDQNFKGIVGKIGYKPFDPANLMPAGRAEGSFSGQMSGWREIRKYTGLDGIEIRKTFRCRGLKHESCFSPSDCFSQG